MVERKCYEAHEKLADAIMSLSDSIRKQNVSNDKHMAMLGSILGSSERQNKLIENQNRTTEKLMNVMTCHEKITKIHTTTLQQCIAMILEKEEKNTQGKIYKDNYFPHFCLFHTFDK